MHYLHARGIGGGGGGLRFEESLSVSSVVSVVWCVCATLDRLCNFPTLRLRLGALSASPPFNWRGRPGEGAFTLLATVPVHKGRNLNDVSTGSGREVPKKQTKMKGGCVIVKLRAVCDLLGEFWAHIAFFSLRRWDTTNL